MPADQLTETRFILADHLVRELTSEFGSPLYVVDEAHMRAKISRYRAAFSAVWPDSELTFATKANSTLALIRIAAQEGCLIDVASEGEFRAALLAGVPANRCHLHGNNKTEQEIAFAVQQGINQIVVDNFEEIETIYRKSSGKTCPDLVIRLAPGVDPKTNAKISTGQADTKFGFNIADGSGEKALLLALSHNLPVVGFHCHVGSQLLDPTAQINGGEALALFAAEMKQKHGFITQVLNVGGGLGIHYHGESRPISVEEYCRNLVEPIARILRAKDLNPKLVQEPGRSLVGESGVTLYRVGVVKTVPSPAKGQRTYLAVDGGLSDNPRPALYGSLYTVLHTPGQPRELVQESTQEYTVSGKHCETDKLFEDVMLPPDVKSGDYLQVLCTGAYNSSMASNYNRYQRPATILIRQNGSYSLVQRNDTYEEMFARESVPSDL
ncbi:MAG: diaminopimelate decarboxylase [Fimbriimonadaceae bacterium]|jgi:diaminopimelate decarboxylase|nr:diaminopimelate decarboxylase [Fimbriimonadaceae bacterium]